MKYFKYLLSALVLLFSCQLMAQAQTIPVMQRSQTATTAKKNTIKVDARGWAHPETGNIAPDFLQYDVNGKPVHLSDFKGKYVLLDFWASTCVPCRKQHPLLIELYNKYKNKNFTILSVSTDSPAAKANWLAAVKKDKLTWTQVSGTKEAATKYGVLGLPRNFLINPAGEIINLDLHGEALKKQLANLLK